MDKKVSIVEMGLRDGLQSIETNLSTTDKIRLINCMCAAGIQEIEVGSFVNPKLIPSMANTEEVMSNLTKFDGVTYTGLVPNVKYTEKAIQAGVTKVATMLSASETHNQKNINRSIAQSLNEISDVIALCSQESIPVRGYISTAFGCPFEGNVPKELVLDLIHKLEDLGVSEVSLADTTGMANPLQITELIQLIISEQPTVNLAIHLHNTRGLGIANALAAFNAGIRTFDSSLGEIGGCPFAPGAAGNVSTEELVYMFGEMGIESGINIHSLFDCATMLESFLGFELKSYLLKAGLPNITSK